MAELTLSTFSSSRHHHMVHIKWCIGKKHLRHHYVNDVASAITLTADRRLTDSQTEKLSSSPAEIRTHANDSADAEKP